MWIKSGLCTGDSFINIALCCLGYVPGLIHAWYIIAKNPERDYDYEPIADSEAGRGGNRVSYNYVSHTPEGPGGQRSGGYGTAGASPNTAPIGRGVNKSAPPPAIAGHGQGAGQSDAAGSSQDARGNVQGAPPSYSEAIGGDHKVQRQN